MILTCPECKTRYLLNEALLGPGGRVVRCAKCGNSWKAEAPPPAPSDDPASLADVPIRRPANEPETAASDGTDRQANWQTAAQFAEPPIERPIRPRPIPRGSNLPAIRGKQKSSPLIGWSLLGGFVLLVVGSGYAFRDIVANNWTPSQRLYHALGIEFTSKGGASAQKSLAASPAKALAQASATAPMAWEVLLFKGLMAKPHYDGDVLVLTFEGTIENPTTTAITLSRIRAVAQDEAGAPLKDWIFSVEATAIPANGNLAFSTELRGAPLETRRIIPAFLPNAVN